MVNIARLTEIATTLFKKSGRREFKMAELQKDANTVYGIARMPSEIWTCRPEGRGTPISLDILNVRYNLGIDFETIETEVPAVQPTIANPQVFAPQTPVQPVAQTVATPVQMSTPSVNVPDQNNFMAYIPEVNKIFHKVGHYNLIKKVVASGQFLPIYIYGISGVGKTTMIEQVCAELKRPFFRTQISADTCDDDLIGSYKLVDGNTIFQYGPVLQAMRSGGVLVLDEFDTNPNMLILQGILEGKPFYIKQTGEIVHPQPGFTIFATGNSSGKGEAIEYIGTSIMNAAQLDRFAIYLKQELPSIAIEMKIAQKFIKFYNINISDTEFDWLFKFIGQTRDAYQNNTNLEYISTRRIGMILKTYAIVGNLKEAVNLVINRFTEETSTAYMLIFDSLKPETPIENHVEEGELIESASENTDSEPTLGDLLQEAVNIREVSRPETPLDEEDPEIEADEDLITHTFG